MTCNAKSTPSSALLPARRESSDTKHLAKAERKGTSVGHGVAAATTGCVPCKCNGGGGNTANQQVHWKWNWEETRQLRLHLSLADEHSLMNSLRGTDSDKETRPFRVAAERMDGHELCPRCEGQTANTESQRGTILYQVFTSGNVQCATRSRIFVERRRIPRGCHCSE